ncbi:Crp/Fnr family transcriptional regulator [Numidum massiliense]|uniref:Crp/Fnr family transcriptional regulator n=1 Tax=Numidum massiliense TaxID=1522315 RepID=UPI0006D54DD6|nr:Crp/Fnr family transcriptional regulator [Numidum massiliense]
MSTKHVKPTQSVKIEQLLQIADRKFYAKRGTYLFREGTVADELYVIASGKVEISKLTSDGRKLSLRICDKNEICGELTLYTQAPITYLFNALVMEDAKVYAVKNHVLEKEIFHNSELGLEFIKWMSDHVRKTMTKFRDLVLHGRKGALYSTLIRMTNSFGVPAADGILIDLSLTNQELANFCGISRESTNRILNELKDKNVISINKKKITIHDLQFLKEEINCENCPAVYCSIE